MAEATVRVTGPVLNVSVRSGTATKSGNPYRITTARVLVEETGVADVTIPDNFPASVTKGELVDLLVDAGTYGGKLDLRAVASLA